MPDDILARFLRRQFDEGMALSAASDLLQLHPLGDDPTDRYVAEYRCRGLVQSHAGSVEEHDRFRVGIWFPPDYLRRADPFQVLTWLGPRVFHPNISGHLPVMCVGRLRPGTSLPDILYQCFEIITYQKYAAHDALNEEASHWTRANLHRLPVDRRPLKWRERQVSA